jgi:phage shock protein A
VGVQLGLVDGPTGPGERRDSLDLAYAQQLDLLAKARRAVADVVTARKRIELQARRLPSTVARLEEQARAALDDGRQDAAREALTRRTMLQEELAELERHASSLALEEARLRQIVSQAELHVHRLRIRREAERASHAAAVARGEVTKALSEASEAASELTLALREAEDRVGRTRSLALDAGRNDAEVTRELTRLEEELLWGPRAEGPEGDRPHEDGSVSG